MSRKINADDIAPATAAEIPVLVDRLKEINGQIEELTAEKKRIEIALSKAAQTMPHETLKDESREGRRVMMPGRKWRVPVVFTSDSIIGSFQDGSAKHTELLGLAGKQLETFFKPPCKWENRFKNGQEFRKAAAEHLAPDIAPKFIVACRQTDKDGIAKSSTVVAIDEAEAVS